MSDGIYLSTDRYQQLNGDLFEQNARQTLGDVWEQQASAAAPDLIAQAQKEADDRARAQMQLEQAQRDHMATSFESAAPSMAAQHLASLNADVAPSPQEVPQSPPAPDTTQTAPDYAAPAPAPAQSQPAPSAPVTAPISAPAAATPTTAGISGGGDLSGRVGARGQQILSSAADTASWLGDQGQKALQAVLMTEGGLAGARGDQGKSAGPLQFYEGGQLANFAQQMGLGLEQAKQYVEAHPEAAIQWAIGTPDKPGYLGGAIQRGLQAGLQGADLATYAQRHGQVSVSPERAGQNFNSMFGTGQDLLGGAGQAVQSVASTVANAIRDPQSIFDAVKPFIGSQYVWGGKSPQQGFDCSGLAGYLAGTGTPESTTSLYAKSAPISAKDAQPGDLVFYNMGQPDMSVQHVATLLDPTNGTIVQSGGTQHAVNIGNANQAIGSAPEYRRLGPGGTPVQAATAPPDVQATQPTDQQAAQTQPSSPIDAFKQKLGDAFSDLFAPLQNLFGGTTSSPPPPPEGGGYGAVPPGGANPLPGIVDQATQALPNILYGPTGRPPTAEEFAARAAANPAARVQYSDNPLDVLGGASLGVPTSGEAATAARNEAIAGGNPLRDVPLVGGATTFAGQAIADPTNLLLFGPGIGKAGLEAGTALAESPEVQAAFRARQPAQAEVGFAMGLPTGNINLAKYPTEVQDVIQAAAPTIPETATRGVVPDAVVRDLAAMSGTSVPDIVANWRPGQAQNAETLYALRDALANQGRSVLDAQQALRSNPGSADAQAALVQALTEHRAVQEVVQGTTAEAGRALRQFTQPVEGNIAALQQLQDLAAKTGQSPDDLAKQLATMDLSDPVHMGDIAKALNPPRLPPGGDIGPSGPTPGQLHLFENAPVDARMEPPTAGNFETPNVPTPAQTPEQADYLRRALTLKALREGTPLPDIPYQGPAASNLRGAPPFSGPPLSQPDLGLNAAEIHPRIQELFGDAPEYRQIAQQGLDDLVQSGANPTQIGRYFAGLERNAGVNQPELSVGGIGANDWFRALRNGAMAGGLSTLGHVFLNIPLQTVASVPREALASVFRGAPEQIPASLIGLFKGYSAGWEAASQQLRYGLSGAEAATGDLASVTPALRATNPVAETAYNALQGLVSTHGVAQTFMENVGFIQKLTQQAWTMAKNEGLSGSAFTNRVEQIVKNAAIDPQYSDMLVTAQQYGQRMALRGAQGTLGRGARGIAQAGPLGNLLVPFEGIAYNVVTRGIELTPAGSLGTGLDVARKAVGLGPYAAGASKAGAAAVAPASERLANNVLGLGLLAYGLDLATHGRVVGHGPDDPTERRAWMDQGGQPDSFVVDGQPNASGQIVGGRYVSGHLFGQFFYPFAAASSFVESQRANPNAPVQEQMADAVRRMSEYVSNETWLRSVAQITDALKTEGGAAQKLEALAANMAESFVPQTALFRNVEQATDPYARQAAKGDLAGRLATAYPGLAGGQPIRQSLTGEPVANPNQGVGIFVPTGRGVPDPVIQLFGNAGIGVPPPPTHVRVTSKYEMDLQPDEQRQYQDIRGQALRELTQEFVKEPDFASLPIEKQRTYLQKAMTKADDIARKQFLDQMPDDQIEQRVLAYQGTKTPRPFAYVGSP